MPNLSKLKFFEFVEWNGSFAGQAEAETLDKANEIMEKMATEDGETWVRDKYVLKSYVVNQEVLAEALDELKIAALKPDNFRPEESLAEYLTRLINEMT